MAEGHRLNGARLAGLVNPVLEERGSPARRQIVPKGRLLFEEGGRADHFYVVERGRIRLELSTQGKATATIQTLGPGDLVGLSWFNPNARWSWDARAVVECEVLAFDAGEVLRAGNQDPELRAEIAGCIANEAIRRLHAARMQLVELFGNAA